MSFALQVNSFRMAHENERKSLFSFALQDISHRRRIEQMSVQGSLQNDRQGGVPSERLPMSVGSGFVEMSRHKSVLVTKNRKPSQGLKERELCG